MRCALVGSKDEGGRRKGRPKSKDSRRSSARTGKTALILFAHGSRERTWARPFTTIRRTIRSKHRGLAVELAFLEIMEPTLEDAIAKFVRTGYRRIVVAPLFMSRGAHLKEDLSRMLAAIRAEHSGTDIDLLPSIGEVRPILNGISEWLVSSVGK
jgi:sirohydrochlorin cobaltochelatase